MSVNYTYPGSSGSIDTAVGTGTSGAYLSVGGPGAESHVACHADISGVSISLEKNVSYPNFVQFSVLLNNPPASAYATFTVTTNALAVLQFAHAGADTYAYFIGVVPNTAVITTGLKVIVKWASTTATSGAVEWSGAIDNAENAHSIDTDSYGTAISVITTTSGSAAYINTTTINIPTANLQSLAADKVFKLKLARRASDTGNDTMADTARLFFVYGYTY